MTLLYDAPLDRTIDPPDSPTVPIRFMGGLPIAAMTRDQSADYLLDAAARPRGRGFAPYVTSANGEVLSRVARDSAVKALFLAADLIHADGQSMVLAARLLGGRALPERVATTDLFHDVARRAVKTGASFYFVGGTPDSLAAMLAQVRRAYPALRIAGTHHGYFELSQETEVASAIDRAAPDVLWVGMGVPLEQGFVVRNRHRLTHVGVIKTAGGLFDFLSGRRSRAPGWMQAAGLEWAYRTLLEPRRLMLRYLTTNPHALMIMLRRSGR